MLGYRRNKSLFPFSHTASMCFELQNTLKPNPLNAQTVVSFIPIFKGRYKEITNSVEEVDLSYKTHLDANTITELMEIHLKKDR